MTAPGTPQSAESEHIPGAKGDDPKVHFIRDCRFVCTAAPTAPCRNYPACECEAWSDELHGDPPAEGHADQPQDECWIKPWLGAADLCDSYEPVMSVLTDDEFPDGPVEIEWDGDNVLWRYAACSFALGHGEYCKGDARFPDTHATLCPQYLALRTRPGMPTDGGAADV